MTANNYGLYTPNGDGTFSPASQKQIIDCAKTVLFDQMKRGDVFDAPMVVRNYLNVQLGNLPYEVFSIMFLDAQHQLLSYKEMFRGTLTQTAVYPREVAREALLLNAAAVILSHNHPSTIVTPSRADELLTQTLKSTLALVDVRVLDHIIVGAGNSLSMAEAGLM